MIEVLSNLHVLLNQPPLWAYILLGVVAFPFYLLPLLSRDRRRPETSLTRNKLKTIGLAWVGMLAAAATVWIALDVSSLRHMGILIAVVAITSGVALGISVGSRERDERGVAMGLLSILFGVIALVLFVPITTLCRTHSEEAYVAKWESLQTGNEYSDLLVYGAKLVTCVDGTIVAELTQTKHPELQICVKLNPKNMDLLTELLKRHVQSKHRREIVHVEWDASKVVPRTGAKTEVVATAISKVFPE